MLHAKRPFLLFLIVTEKTKEMAVWISIPDFRDVCNAADSVIRSGFSDIFAQERTLRKAMDYLDALSCPNIRANSWEIAEWCGHSTPAPVQSLTGENKWDPGKMWDRIAVMAGRLAEGDCEGDPLGPGVIVDETAQEKRGTATAGVGRQYAGCAGKVVNCVNWVFLTMAGPFMRTWAGSGLYLPRKGWFTGRKETGAERRRSAGVPPGTRFATKPGIARKLFRGLRDNGVKFNYAAGDEVYGRSDALRGDHERNREAYAYFVPRDFRVKVPGKGSMKVDDLLERADPQFEERSAGPGMKGLRYYEWALIGLKEKQHFLLIRRPCRQPWGNPAEPDAGTAGDKGETPGKRDRVKEEKITFCLCFIPERSPIKPSMRNMVLMAGRRWAAEEGNATGKGIVGWDENQLRKWGSLQKHTALAGLAMLRSNVIMGMLSGGKPVPLLRDAPRGNRENPGGSAGTRTPSPGRQKPGKTREEKARIPLGDSPAPARAGQNPPADFGYARLSRNEVIRLRNAVMSGASDSVIEFHVEWSNWRRHHQAIAKWHHHAARLSAAARATRPPALKVTSRKVVRQPGRPNPGTSTHSHTKSPGEHSMT
jgi:SRSO17 transposase